MTAPDTIFRFADRHARVAATLAAAMVLAASGGRAHAQAAPAAPAPNVATMPGGQIACPQPPSGQPLIKVPELSATSGSVMSLTEEFQRMPRSTGGGTSVQCNPQLVRVFRAELKILNSPEALFSLGYIQYALREARDTLPSSYPALIWPEIYDRLSKLESLAIENYARDGAKAGVAHELVESASTLLAYLSIVMPPQSRDASGALIPIPLRASRRRNQAAHNPQLEE